MIISASRRTDIPAFYADWFMYRINEGYFVRINPFNSKDQKVISLQRSDVDLFVFWTKNAFPFLNNVKYLMEKGYNFYFQYTINNYPKFFEPKIPELSFNVDTFRKLSSIIGYKKVIWRYDPIIISNMTTVEYHIEKVEKIAGMLSGFADRLVISFVDIYGKVANRFKKIHQYNNLVFSDLLQENNYYMLKRLCQELQNISKKYGFEIYSCSEVVDLTGFGIKKGACIDGDLINNLFKLNKKFIKDKNQRDCCLCVESIDMGMYNTCPHECVYCYANYSSKTIENNLRKHLKHSPTLIGKCREDLLKKIYFQPSLF